MGTWTMTFEGVSGNTTYVSIGNMSENKFLVPADDPVTLYASSSDNPFEPVRGGTGYLRAIGSIADFNELYTSTPNSHPVLIYYTDDEDEDHVIWRGCVKAEAYTLPMTQTKQVIEIPIIDTVSMLSDIKIDSNWGMGYISLAQLLYNIMMATDDRLTAILLPATSAPLTVLKHTLQMCNWVEIADDKNVATNYYRYKPLADIMADVCTAYGWSLWQRGDEWVFGRENTSAYSRVPVGELLNTSPAYTVTFSQDHDIEDLTLAGGQHSVSSRQGASNITVENNPGKFTGTLFSLDLSKAAAEATGKGVLNSSPHIGFVEFYFGTTAKMLGYAGQRPSIGPVFDKFEAYRRGLISNQADTYNPGAGLEDIILADADGHGDEHTGIGFSPHGQSDPGNYIEINTLQAVNVADDTCYLSISGLTKAVYDWASGFENPHSNFHYKIAVNIGNLWLTNFNDLELNVEGWWMELGHGPYNPYTWIYTADNGQFSHFSNMTDPDFQRSPFMEQTTGALVKLPGGATGTIKVRIYVPSNITNSGLVACILENLRISVFRTFALHKENLEGENNKFIAGTGGGYGDYKISGNLTCRSGNQYGTGVILSEKYEEVRQKPQDWVGDWEAVYPIVHYDPVSSLDSTGYTPEVSLGNRIIRLMSSPYWIGKTSMINTLGPFDTIDIGQRTYIITGYDYDVKKEVYTYHLLQQKQ